MDTLLTTRQLQDLLQVDRITIYRMLGDGRLRGFKVGGQWRFPRREIETWLLEQQGRPESLDPSPPVQGDATLSSEALPLACVQTIQDVCAEVLNIALVTVSLDGSPLTEISHGCDFCRLVLSRSEGLRRCRRAWLSGAERNGRSADRCHAGLLCVSGPVWVGSRQVAAIAGCQFSTDPPGAWLEADGWQASLLGMAAELDLDVSDLEGAAGSVRQIAPSEASHIPRLVERIAATFSEIGQERLSLLSRLQDIAQISKI